MIPKKLLKEILDDPYYKRCARRGPDCDGRITFDHAWIYGGRQIQEKWAIVPVCWYHHLGGGLSRPFNQWISICRATDEDLAKYPNMTWDQSRQYLGSMFGKKQ